MIRSWKCTFVAGCLLQYVSVCGIDGWSTCIVNRVVFDIASMGSNLWSAISFHFFIFSCTLFVTSHSNPCFLRFYSKLGWLTDFRPPPNGGWWWGWDAVLSVAPKAPQGKWSIFPSTLIFFPAQNSKEKERRKYKVSEVHRKSAKQKEIMQEKGTYMRKWKNLKWPAPKAPQNMGLRGPRFFWNANKHPFSEKHCSSGWYPVFFICCVISSLLIAFLTLFEVTPNYFPPSDSLLHFTFHSQSRLEKIIGGKSLWYPPKAMLPAHTPLLLPLSQGSSSDQALVTDCSATLAQYSPSYLKPS